MPETVQYILRIFTVGDIYL